MKFRPTLLLFLSSIFLLHAKCKKDKTDAPAVLPPITQTGANTFGCKVNGEVWLPYSSCSGFTTNPCQELFVDIFKLTPNQQYQTPLGIEIRAAIKNKDNSISSFSLSTPTNRGISATGNKNDSISLKHVKPGIVEYIEIPGMDLTNNIIITKLDTINKIISGTFEATLYRSLNDSVKITEGRFDVKFQVCKCSN